MPLSQLLSQDWSDYDRKKEGDALFFTGKAWEVDYLEHQIYMAYMRYSRHQIRRAIMVCCRAFTAGLERSAFIKNVVQSLEEC